MLTLESIGGKANAIKAILALIIMLTAGVYGGMKYLATASELEKVEAVLTQRIVMNEQADKEYRLQRDIKDVRLEIRKIENTYGVDDPLQIPNIRDREYYRDLNDQLEYFQKELERMKGGS